MSEFRKLQIEQRKSIDDYYWKWFQYHAQQRYENFRLFVLQLFLTPAGILAVAYSKMNIGTSFQSMFVISAALFVESWLCFIFYRIDRRNETLVKLGEAGLIEFEKKFIVKFSLPTILLRDGITKPESDWFHSHNKLLEALFKTAIIVFFISGATCLMIGLAKLQFIAQNFTMYYLLFTRQGL